jgi:hypothetical protein
MSEMCLHECGREAVLVLRQIKEAIENPSRMLIEI